MQQPPPQQQQGPGGAKLCFRCGGYHDNLFDCYLHESKVGRSPWHDKVGPQYGKKVCLGCGLESHRMSDCPSPKLPDNLKGQVRQGYTYHGYNGVKYDQRRSSSASQRAPAPSPPPGVQQPQPIAPGPPQQGMVNAGWVWSGAPQQAPTAPPTVPPSTSSVSDGSTTAPPPRQGNLNRRVGRTRFSDTHSYGLGGDEDVPLTNHDDEDD